MEETSLLYKKIYKVKKKGRLRFSEKVLSPRKLSFYKSQRKGRGQVFWESAFSA